VGLNENCCIPKKIAFYKGMLNKSWDLQCKMFDVGPAKLKVWKIYNIRLQKYENYYTIRVLKFL